MHRLANQSPRCFSGLPVRGQHLRNRLGVGLGGAGKHLFDCTRDSHKRDAPLQKRLHGHLVGGIQGDAMRSALFGGIKSQAQARKALEIGRLELQVPAAPPNQT